MNLSLVEVARILGVAADGVDPRIRVTGAVVDSRLVKPGDLFFAVKGEFLDGHDFAAEALRRGAPAVIVGRPVEEAIAPAIMVEDPIGSLAVLSGWVRDVFNPTVVGITGSTGKTSVKDLLAAILRTQMQVVASEKSFNNELGVPLTLAGIKPETQVVVVEMGARGPGQIRQLCELARPHLGIVTNVGVTHFETFGSRTAIAQAKGELIESVPAGGAVVLNADDPLVSAMASRRADLVEVFSFGMSPEAWLRAEGVQIDRLGRPTFRIVQGSTKGIWVTLHASGIHQVTNALAACAAAMSLGMTLQECRPGLETAEISPWRMQVREVGGAVIVNDAYNANPTSVASALLTASRMTGDGGRLMVVLGHMAELGSLAETEHLRVGALAASLATRLVAIGPGAAPIAEGARQEGMTEVTRVASAGEAAAVIGRLEPGDVLLIKGSRVAALEEISDLVAEGMSA